MQRNDDYIYKALDEVQKVRDQLNIYLGAQYHIASETHGIYIYPYDHTGHLTQLQAITGQFTDDPNVPFSLWDLKRSPLQNMTTNNLYYFIELLNNMLNQNPEDKCELPNDELTVLIKNTIEGLTSAYFILFDNEELSLQTDASEDLAASLASTTISPEDTPVNLWRVRIPPLPSSPFVSPFTIFAKVYDKFMNDEKVLPSSTNHSNDIGKAEQMASSIPKKSMM